MAKEDRGNPQREQSDRKRKQRGKRQADHDAGCDRAPIRAHPVQRDRDRVAADPVEHGVCE
ncbi:hypothetical protein ACVWZV_001437 [Bradyrhizobium sp. GM5.1]